MLPRRLSAALRALGALAPYLGLGGRGSQSVEDPASLVAFVESRASHVAQSSLFGYLKTRAGTRFPALFEHPAMLESINVAKWQTFAASVSDLAVFSGGLLLRRGLSSEEVRTLMTDVVTQVFVNSGEPEEAGDSFPATCGAVRERIAGCRWDEVGDDETAFVESPRALVHWAPVVDELKQFDEEIVRNSIRFRWIDVRRELRARLADPFPRPRLHPRPHP